MYERFDDILARRKFSTYRKIRKFLQNNIVEINGQRVTTGGVQVNLFTDKITFNSKAAELPPDLYIMMNKKEGTLCANSQDPNKDGEKYPLVFDSLPQEICNPQFIPTPLHTVGRLDADTTGLLILTTNGNFSHRLSIPEFHVDKTYEVTLHNPVSQEEQDEYIKKCAEGIFCDHKHCSPAFTAQSARLVFVSESVCHLTIQEGKFHQVKRMVDALGNSVAALKRIGMGKLNLDKTLAPGEWRFLTPEEIDLLC